jgi:hypothetical protein
MASIMKRALVVGVVIAALMTWAGASVVPITSASSGIGSTLRDRGSDRAVPVAPLLRPAPVRDARRRPQPQPLAVAVVPFVCAVHLADADAAVTD